MLTSQNELMTAEEVAKYMRLPQSTVYKLVQEGKLPGFKVGRHWRFRRETLVQWVHDQEQASTSRIAAGHKV
jgi:excisionase family DNA binding protein